MMLRPELSTWVSSVKFNNTFRAPLASSFCRWRSSSSLSPIVDLPRRSTMVTSSRTRVEIVRPTTSPSDLHPVMVPISPLDYIAQSLHPDAIGDGTPNAVQKRFPKFWREARHRPILLRRRDP